MTPDAAPNKLYLIDGTAQLFRAYFAISGLTSAEAPCAPSTWNHRS